MSDETSGADAVAAIGPVFIDPYVIVDANGNVTDFNPHYRALFTRAQARKLKGGVCCQFLRLGICDAEGCLAKQCRTSGTPARYDEIPAVLEGEEDAERRFIVSAQPVGEGTLILLRDVSDLADVQRKYKQMHEREALEKTRLQAVIHSRTQELLEANKELNRIQKELVQHKKGLFG